jgi:RNA recognition motif-containing protein
MKLYVGNLPFQTTQADLEDMFSEHGSVTNASLMMDRATGRSRGFGFVTMGSSAEGEAAIAAKHGRQVGGRALTVNEARPREERPVRSFAGSRR